MQTHLTYFVAEDRSHLRHGHHGYISACGWDYSPDAVVWAGDYEPDAYAACDDCIPTPGVELANADVLVVQGVYAIGDDSHLWTSRSRTTWHSVCGRSDPDVDVAWADSEWPEAYDHCNACLDLVDQDLWQPDTPDQLPTEMTEARRYELHRVWIVQDGTEHRARNRDLAVTMCGQPLREGATPRFSQSADVQHCHRCDTAVGRERVGLPPLRTQPAPVTRLPRKPETAAAGSKRHKKSNGIPKKKTQTSSAGSTRKAAQANSSKDIALYGRKMIVPIRFVRGGAPGLGRRR